MNMSVCMIQCECEKCSLKARINEVNGRLDFIHVKRSSFLEYKELYNTGWSIAISYINK